MFERFAASPPANSEEIQSVQERLSYSLPTGYVEFLLTANGGEGFVGSSCLILWKVEELISKNVAYNVTELAPELFLFGSDGGGEAFGFDNRSAAREIVSVPFVAMEIQDAKILASSFEEFLSVLLRS